jgi:hypothetical protein
MSWPKTLYRIPNPEWGVSEGYEIVVDAFPGPVPDPHRRWFVRELHGWWEEATKTYHHKVETLHPTDTVHFLTIDEAIHEANQQVLLRARDGFRFLFTIDYMKSEPPWHARFEVVLPARNKTAGLRRMRRSRA